MKILAETNDLVRIITQTVLDHLAYQGKDPFKKLVPVAVSNRHVHLAAEDLAALFGEGYILTKARDLSQPGQFACEERVTLAGPQGVIENVRILGPVRDKTQVEIAPSDASKLGLSPPVRDSGDLAGSPGIALVGPQGALNLPEGVIIAARHIHMHTRDAQRFGLKDKDRVSVKIPGPRSLVFNDVLVRAGDNYKLEMHVDIDEANASLLKNNQWVEIL